MRRGERSERARKRAKVAFLAKLKKIPHVGEACREAKITYQTAYEWRKADPEFAAQWDECVEHALDTIEIRGMNMAQRGSAAMIQFFLKTRRRKVYGDVTRHEIPEGMAGVLIVPGRMKPEDWDGFADGLRTPEGGAPAQAQ